MYNRVKMIVPRMTQDTSGHTCTARTADRNGFPRPGMSGTDTNAARRIPVANTSKAGARPSTQARPTINRMSAASTRYSQGAFCSPIVSRSATRAMKVMAMKPKIKDVSLVHRESTVATVPRYNQRWRRSSMKRNKEMTINMAHTAM